jgi:hypothetical protein
MSDLLQIPLQQNIQTKYGHGFTSQLPLLRIPDSELFDISIFPTLKYYSKSLKLKYQFTFIKNNLKFFLEKYTDLLSCIIDIIIFNLLISYNKLRIYFKNLFNEDEYSSINNFRILFILLHFMIQLENPLLEPIHSLFTIHYGKIVPQQLQRELYLDYHTFEVVMSILQVEFDLAKYNFNYEHLRQIRQNRYLKLYEQKLERTLSCEEKIKQIYLNNNGLIYWKNIPSRSKEVIMEYHSHLNETHLFDDHSLWYKISRFYESSRITPSFGYSNEFRYNGPIFMILPSFLPNYTVNQHLKIYKPKLYVGAISSFNIFKEGILYKNRPYTIFQPDILTNLEIEDNILSILENWTHD